MDPKNEAPVVDGTEPTNQELVERGLTHEQRA